MKKIICLTVSLFIVLIFAVDAFAAGSISGSIKQSHKSIEVNFQVTGLNEADQITILVYKKDDLSSPPSMENIVYVDQINAETNVISFQLLKSAADGDYEVLMAGTNTAKTQIGSFTIENFIPGDVNNNGILDIGDAIWIIRFNKGSVIPPEIKTVRGDADENGVVKSEDVLWILTKTAGE